MNLDSKNSKLNELKSILDGQIEFVELYRGLLDTNNVQFLVDNHWITDRILPNELKEDLDKFIAESRQPVGSPANLIKYFAQENFSDKFYFLNSLLKRLKDFQTEWNLKVLTPEEILLQTKNQELIEFNQRVNEKFSIIEKQNRFMNLKKSYEVDHMSKFVGGLCKKNDIYTVSN